MELFAIWHCVDRTEGRKGNRLAAETGILTAQKLRQAEDEKDIVEQGRLERIGATAGLALHVKYRISIKDFQLVAGTRNHLELPFEAVA